MAALYITPAASSWIELSFFDGCIHVRLMEDIDALEMRFRNEARGRKRFAQEHLRDSEKEELREKVWKGRR